MNFGTVTTVSEAKVAMKGLLASGCAAIVPTVRKEGMQSNGVWRSFTSVEINFTSVEIRNDERIAASTFFFFLSFLYELSRHLRVVIIFNDFLVYMYMCRWCRRHCLLTSCACLF